MKKIFFLIILITIPILSVFSQPEEKVGEEVLDKLYEQLQNSYKEYQGLIKEPEETKDSNREDSVTEDIKTTQKKPSGKEKKPIDSSDTSAKSQAEKLSFYYISPGDSLEISVYGEPDLKKTVRVSEEGTINYSLLGEVKVEGLTAGEVMIKIKNLLEKDFLVNPQVDVLVKEFAKFNILGEVKKPGSYELKGLVTVIDAISLAGGFTPIASQNGVRVVRIENGKEKVIRVPVANILKSGNKSKDIILKKGDTIVVPESFF